MIVSADPADDRPVNAAARFLPRLEGAAMIAAGLVAAALLAYPATIFTGQFLLGRPPFGVRPWATGLAAAGFLLGSGGLGGFLIVRGVCRFLPKKGAAAGLRR